jgi:L-asparagine transporter-like permease
MNGSKKDSAAKGGLSAGHLVMLSLGTVIGGSFFLGSSVAIRAAGPSVVLAYILGGVLVYYILYAMSEMTVAAPHCGGFKTFAAKAFGERTGFVVGWVYWAGMVLGMSSEATAASILLSRYLPGISLPLTGSVIIIAVTLLNLLGTVRLSKLESGLAGIKIAAVVSFIVIAFLLITGLSGRPAVGLGEIAREPLAPGGLGGLFGSMLVVMFSYCGFEVIALAASETAEPHKTIPKAIRYTVVSLFGLFLLYIFLLMPLVPAQALDENTSAIVVSLTRHGFVWAGTVLGLVIISAILSSILATMFGLGRMMRALADDNQAPRWLREKTDVPYRGIIASGIAMLLSLWFGQLFPRVYLFLLSSGGFAILFTYAVMMASQMRLRKKHGCPPDGKCQLPGYPYTSGFVLVSLIVAILSIPFVRGQLSGLIAGIVLLIFFEAAFSFLKFFRSRGKHRFILPQIKNSNMAAEFSEELTDVEIKDKKK